MKRNWLFPLLLSIVLCGRLLSGSSFADSKDEPLYAQPRELATLEEEEIVESSGIAPSQRHVGIYWTHNDSGDEPRLFAFDHEGKKRATCEIVGAEAVDWEDICSFTRDGKSWLLVGDIGDNRAVRESVVLYLIEEPADLSTETLQVHQTITFRYSDGPRNSEGLAYDPTDKTIWLVDKRATLLSNVYQLEWPDPQEAEEVQMARRVARVPIPITTAFDMSSDGKRAVILTMGDAFEFHREEEETWAEAFSVAPLRIRMPNRKQGESICYSLDGRSLLLTSEKLPTPLWEVRQEE